MHKNVGHWKEPSLVWAAVMRKHLNGKFELNFSGTALRVKAWEAEILET